MPCAHVSLAPLLVLLSWQRALDRYFAILSTSSLLHSSAIFRRNKDILSPNVVSLANPIHLAQKSTTLGRYKLPYPMNKYFLGLL